MKNEKLNELIKLAIGTRSLRQVEEESGISHAEYGKSNRVGRNKDFGFAQLSINDISRWNHRKKRKSVHEIKHIII